MVKQAADLYDKVRPNPLGENPVTQEILQLIDRYDQLTKDLDREARLIFEGKSAIKQSDLKKFQRRANYRFNRIDESIKNWTEICVPKSYMAGSDLVDMMAEQIEKGSSRYLGSIDRKQMKEYLDKIKDKSFREVKMVNDGMRQRLDDIIYEGIRDSRSINLTKRPGIRGGTTTKDQIGTRIYQTILNEGIKLEDAAGRLWDPGAYARMYARTRTREWQTQGTEDNLKRNGLDLVRISQHVDVDGWDICNEYEDKIFSLSGNHPTFPMLDQHTPFHPNCAHVETPYVEEIEEFIKARKEGENIEEAATKAKKETAKAKPLIVNPDIKNLDPGLNDKAAAGLEKVHKDVRIFGQKYNKEQLATINVNDGTEAFKKLGGSKSQVKFTDEYQNFLNGASDNSLIMIHNHPSSSSFSVEDIHVANSFKSIRMMTVEGHNGFKYSLKVEASKRDKLRYIKSTRKNMEKRYYDYFYDQVVNKDLDQTLAWQIHSHLANKDLAEYYGWDYKRILPKDIDSDLFDRINKIEKEALDFREKEALDFREKERKRLKEAAKRRGLD